jgi:hypothetical protein
MWCAWHCHQGGTLPCWHLVDDPYGGEILIHHGEHQHGNQAHPCWPGSQCLHRCILKSQPVLSTRCSAFRFFQVPLRHTVLCSSHALRSAAASSSCHASFCVLCAHCDCRHVKSGSAADKPWYVRRYSLVFAQHIGLPFKLWKVVRPLLESGLC